MGRSSILRIELRPLFVSEDDMADRGKVHFTSLAKKFENGSLPNIDESRSVDVVLDLIWFHDPDFGEELLRYLT